MLTAKLSFIYTWNHCEEMFQSVILVWLCTCQCKASRGGGGWVDRAWGGDLTLFRNLQSNSLPMGKSFQSNATKFSSWAAHCAVKYPKAGSKKGTIKISPNKILKSLFILRCCITKDVPVTAAIIHFNHNPCYSRNAWNTETFRRKSTFWKF